MNPPHHIILIELNFSGRNPILAFLNEIVHWCMHATVAKKGNFLSKLLDIITFGKLLLLRNKIIMTWKICIEYIWTMMSSNLIKTYHNMKVLSGFDFKDSYTLNVLSGFDFKRLSHYESFLQVLFKKTLTCAFQIAFDQKVDADHYLEEALMEQVFSYINFLEPSFFLQ